MAHYWSEGVSTLRFTAREFQQELVEEGLKHNLLTCPPSSAASFVSLKLIQELAYQIRRPQKRRTVILTQLHRLKKMAFELSHLTDLQTVALSYTQDCADFNKIVSSYEIIVCSSEILDFLLEENLINLTLINLLVIEQCHMVVEDASLQKIMSRYTNEKKQSLSSEFLPRILAFTHPLFTNYTNDTITKNTNKVKRVFDQYSNDLPLDRATILDAKNTSSQSNEQTGIECLKTFTDLQCLDVDKETMEMNSFQYWSTPHDNFLNNDVIVDNDVKDPNKLKETLNDEEELNISKSEGSAYDILECHLEKLEKILCCKADMASDIVGLKRITGKPKEVIIECKAISDEDKCPDRVQLENFMKITALGSLKFLEDHRYDPTEIYGDDLFSDELRAIPDPRTEPKEMLELFLYVLEQAGPYAADKAAFSLLIKIEKLKIKIPYERHFLLLCLVTSTLIQIRAATDLIFEKYLTDREKIRLFSTPKVLRLMDVLKLFKPSEINQRSTDISPKFTKYNIEMKPENPLSSLENKGESLSNAPLKVLKNSHHTGSSEKNNCDIKMNPQNQKDLNSVSLLEDDGKQKRIIEKFNSKEGLESSKDKIIQVTEDIIVDDDPLQIVDLRINSVSNHKGEQNKILNVLDNLSESPLQIKKLDDSSILLNEEIQKQPRHKGCEFVQNKELIYLNKADHDSKGRNKNLASENSSNILLLSSNFNDTNLDLKNTAINTKKLICLNNTLQNIEFDFKRLGREIENKYNNISNIKCSVNHANISGDQSMGDILGSGESEAKQCSDIDNLKEGNDCTQLKNSECTAFDELKGISKTKDNEGNSKIPSDSNFSSNKMNVPLDNESICKIDSCENANSEKNKANLNKCNVSNTNNEGNQEKKTLLFTNKSDSVKNFLKDSPTKKYDNFRGRGKGRGGKGYGYQGRYQHGNSNDPDALCGLIFVEESLIAKILSTIINEYCRTDENLKFVCAQYTVDKVADPLTDSKEAESEHRLQEEVLKRFRIHECNLLVGTSFLEEGMDLPKCNLVIRWDIPKGYRSYARCRARARAPRSLYALLALPPSEPLITTLANYTHIERMLVRKCGWREPPASEEADAVRFSALIESYRPSGAAVNLSSAVGLLNRYCAKLPSDTFTRLVPLWSMERIFYQGICLYVCTIRLPINCPLKHHIVGHPMPNRVLARRIAALQACKALHRAGELDDNLMPIGKEGFRAMESDWLSVPPQSDLPKLCDSSQVDPHGTQMLSDFEPRPGTTKRKQYYYKKVAQALTDCRPIVGQPCLAYQINAWLACPLPERHNTRGRKLHPPEAYAEGFAILTSKPIQQIPVFPIFTRSGEVRVALQRLPGGVILSRHREKLIHNFMKYTFAEVLRVHNHLMIFDDFGKQSRNSYYVVPTHKATEFKGVNTPVAIDWNFLQLIFDQTNSNNATSIVTKSPFFDNSSVNLPDKTQNKGAKNVKSDDLNGKKKLMKEECFAENGNIETISNSLDIKNNQQGIELFQNNIECVKNITECNKATVEIKCKKNEVIDCKKNIVVVEKLKSNLTIDKGIEINESGKNTNHVVINEIYNGDKLKDENKSTTLIESTKDTSLNICNFKKSCICVKCKKALIVIKKDNTNVTDVAINNESKDQSVEDDAVNVEEILPNPYLAPGEAFVFDSEKFRDAVVMPWYRNQDQPQYFYVAEICWHLSPCSAFPSAQHSTFEQYYKQKYGVKITQTCQPLLDVDHTSARLNLLTPRFVNRKGVALPTSSERTKRAKRESLEQKQILVPELCCAHPFRGALWRAAVALPCVLYRINSLLLADEIRRSVALCVALGIPKPDTKFEWPPLDFGWSLAEVLAGDISKESKADIINIDYNQGEEKIFSDGAEIDSITEDTTDKPKTANDLLKEKEDADERTSVEAFEIGTWSNDMAASVPIDALEIHDYEDDELISATSKLPGNLTICTSMEGGPDWSLSGNELSSPQPIPSRSQQRKYSMADSDASYVSSEFDISEEESSSSDADSDDVDTNANSTDTLSEKGGIRIEYKAGNEAEAIEVATIPSKEKKNLDETIDIKVEKDAEEISMKAFHSFFYKHDNEDSETIQYVKEFRKCIASNESSLKNNGILVKYDHNMEHLKPQSLATSPYHMDNISLKNTNKPVSKCDLYNENPSNLRSISKDKLLHDREVSKLCVNYKDKSMITDLSEKKIIALSEMNSSKINTNKEIEKIDLRSNTDVKCSYSDEYRRTKNKCDKLISMNDDEYLNEIDPYVEDDNVNPFPESFEMALSKEESLELYREMFPYLSKNLIESEWYDHGLMENGIISLDNLERNKRKILNVIKASMPKERWMKLNLFGMKDLDEVDYENNILKLNANNSENSNASLQSHYDESQKIDDENQQNNHKDQETIKNVDDNIDDKNSSEFSFSFDFQPDLYNHPGPSPSLILQALTMSNANDGINLERLETIGDSFLKYAITTYLYCTYQNIHEGKLSHLRSKQVSNLNLYRLGRRKSLGSRMVAYKFEPHDNWLPPCHRVPPHLERALIDTHIPSSLWNIADMPPLIGLSKDEIEKLVREKVTHYHTVPSKYNNLMDRRIKEDENCIFHGKYSKLVRDLTISCCESISKMENNEQNKNTEQSIDGNEDTKMIKEQKLKTSFENACDNVVVNNLNNNLKDGTYKCTCTIISNGSDQQKKADIEKDLNLMDSKEGEYVELAGVPCFVPYNLITQHSIPDKSVADCVEALIGAYLIECGPRGALLFMAWLGIRVLPKEEVILPLDHPFVQLKIAEMKEDASFKEDSKSSNLVVFEDPIDKDDQSDVDYAKDCNKETREEIEQDPYDNQDENSDFDENDCWNWKGRVPGSLKPEKNDKGEWVQIVYGELKPPPSPLLRYVPDPEGELAQMLSGYDGLERTLGYQFKDRCYLLQAMTHASYSPNRLTDCYQRLEFLGDAVLDYLITRQLYEDPRRHSPGALTDLRSALVNNTIFASLAVRHGMHKYFRHLSPGLNEVLARFVKIQEENGHSISEEHYLIQEDECEQVEDVEVPKALGDLFESIAGAIFLDSGMSLDAVWKVYHALMKREIEAFSESVPKSPVRELLEMEPETAKFGKPEKLADGRRVRVTVEVLGVGVFKGVGRNYRIAKCTAAKCALRRLAPSANRRHKK